MIKIEKLNKIYNINKVNQYEALKDIDLNIQKNSLVILKGVSGSGKSTLLSIIASFSKPTDGFVEVLDEQIAKLPDSFISSFRQKHIGFVFQSFNLFESLSVKDNLLSALVGLDIDSKELDSMIDKALEISNISHKKDQRVSSLSGGEKQRCAIARAIVNNPDIILCDEPTANLDKENSKIFISILKDLKAIGKTIVLATHDPLFDELDIVDEILTLEDGEIVDK